MQVRNISIWSPSLSGGGAEKISKYLIDILINSGFKVSVCTHDQQPLDLPPQLVFFKMPSVHLSGCLYNAIRYIIMFNSTVHFLNLNYINLAIFLRFLSPRVKIIVRCANTISVEIASLPPLRRFLTYLLYGVNFYASDSIIVQCQYMKKDISKLYPFASSKLIVIYNPSMLVKSVSSTVESPPSALSRSPYILTGASWKPQKDFHTLLKAYSFYTKMQKYPLPLLVAGVDDNNTFFLELVQKYKCDSNLVIPLGYVDNLDSYIKGSAFAVLSSHYEGFSNFLVECICYNKLIIATDCPGGNRELANMYTGISLFKPANWLELSSLFIDISSSYNLSTSLPMLKSNEVEESFVRNLYLDLFSSQFPSLK